MMLLVVGTKTWLVKMEVAACILAGALVAHSGKMGIPYGEAWLVNNNQNTFPSC